MRQRRIEHGALAPLQHTKTDAFASLRHHKSNVPVFTGILPHKTGTLYRFRHWKYPLLFHPHWSHFLQQDQIFHKIPNRPAGRSTARSPFMSDRSPFKFREEAGDRSHDPPKKSEFICDARDSFHRGLQHTGIAVINLLSADHVHELIGDIDIRLFQRSRHDVAGVRCTGPTRCRITT